MGTKLRDYLGIWVPIITIVLVLGLGVKSALAEGCPGGHLSTVESITQLNMTGIPVDMLRGSEKKAFVEYLKSLEATVDEGEDFYFVIAVDRVFVFGATIKCTTGNGILPLKLWEEIINGVQA